ncbi:MAG TPA: methyltransferase domain-containing protein [Candidatus Lokiarchaeia archaeon]|nr:methyltransferase domain-containing protein [Candidatus Lokiarchaeia archaeon]
MNLFKRKAKDVSYYDIQSQADLPFLATPEEVITEAFKVLEHDFGLRRKSHQKFIDLGSGTGDVVLRCAREYGIPAHGIEINENLVNIARQKVKQARLKHVKLWKGDLFAYKLEQYDFIFLFSLPHNQKFLNHVFVTAKHGAIITAYKYPLDELEPLLSLKKTQVVKVDGKSFELFFYERV